MKSNLLFVHRMRSLIRFTPAQIVIDPECAAQILTVNYRLGRIYSHLNVEPHSPLF